MSQMRTRVEVKEPPNRKLAFSDFYKGSGAEGFLKPEQSPGQSGAVIDFAARVEMRRICLISAVKDLLEKGNLRVDDMLPLLEWNPQSMGKSLFNAQTRRILWWSACGSAGINAFLFSAAIFGPDSLYRKFADALAAPPGLVANMFFTPREHSAGAFISAALLSLGFSLLFYGIVSWIILQGFMWGRSVRRHA